MPQQADRDYRTRIYQSYNESLAKPLRAELQARAPFLRRLIRSHFPSDRTARILEIGCGHGALIHFALEAGYSNIRGIDRSPTQLAEAKRIGLEEFVSYSDATQHLRSTAPASLDAIAAIDLIEHLTKPELLALADDLFRVLQPGGRLVLHTVNGDSPFFGQSRYHDFTHENAFTQDSINQVLRTAGFVRVECFENTPIVHGLKSAIRLTVWKLWRFILRVALMAETGAASRILTQNFLVVAYK